MQDLIPRVLIADDEVGFRNIVKKALPAFQVFEAENGKIAFDLIHSEKLDLVITYIKMPVMAVSGYADAEDVEKHNFAAFLDRPVNLQQFQLLVETLLSQKQQPAIS
ncbi:MAG: response regulator [Candidatus Handelsmanbacteria bacterium]|nr:response regulator [Candidatus Handelsmanbacteria bacterium]